MKHKPDLQMDSNRAAVTRADFLRLAAGATSALLLAVIGGRESEGEMTSSGKISTRPIPSSGEMLPVIGCGTYRVFDVDADSDVYRRLPDVLRTLFAAGGSVLDSSPMYGRAEQVVGELLAAAGSREQAFLATKVWTSGREAGIAQMEESFRLFRTPRIDLMQVHNLLDWQTHLATLRKWKEAGRIRYLGVTHYTASAYDRLEAVMQREKLDFVQLNYALDDRDAERRLLPLAAERGIAIVVNRPFGGGGLLRRLHDRPLPPWAAEIDCTSWAQILLKFILGNPSVTCVIPGTGRAEHMADNCRAGTGPLPDAALRRKMIAYIEDL